MRFSPETGRILLAGVCLIGVALAASIEITGADLVNEDLFGWMIGGVFAFAMIGWSLRWLFVRDVDLTFLAGWLPLALMLSKFVGLVTVLTLFLLWLFGLAVGGPVRPATGHALITGLVVCALLGMASTGMLHLLVVYRHLTGTLEPTSRPLDEND
jgi:hypothetical protein